MPRGQYDRSKKRARPSNKQTWAAYKALESHREEYLEKKPKFQDVMASLSEELGFEVSYGLFKSARADTGVDWKPKVKEKPLKKIKTPKDPSPGYMPKISLADYKCLKADVEKLQNDFADMQTMFAKQTQYISEIFNAFELDKKEAKT